MGFWVFHLLKKEEGDNADKPHGRKKERRKENDGGRRDGGRKEKERLKKMEIRVKMKNLLAW
jgi:hypothetical protein